jgi:hypothetical protein
MIATLREWCTGPLVELNSSVFQILHFVDANQPVLCGVRLFQNFQLEFLRKDKNINSNTPPLWQILTSLNFKLLVLSVGSGLEIHVVCGRFSLV